VAFVTLKPAAHASRSEPRAQPPWRSAATTAQGFVASDEILYQQTSNTQKLLDTAHSCTCPAGRNVCICTSYRAPPILKPLAARVLATASPTAAPSLIPTLNPTMFPSLFPTLSPTVGTPLPSQIPTAVPSMPPTLAPTMLHTAVPSFLPTVVMTLPPSSVEPTLAPTASPTIFPTLFPSAPPAPPKVVDVLNKTSVTTTVREVPVVINGTDEYQTVKRIDIVRNITETTTEDERDIPHIDQVVTIPNAPVSYDVPWWAQDMGAHIPPAQPIVAAGYPQIYIYCINHTGKRLFFSLDGVKYNIVPAHGVNRQAAFGHEVWSVVAEDGTPLLQAETTEANQRFIVDKASPDVAPDTS